MPKQPEKFTAEELPTGHAIMIAKLPTGEEAAVAFTFSDLDISSDRVVNAARLLRQVIEGKP